MSALTNPFDPLRQLVAAMEGDGNGSVDWSAIEYAAENARAVISWLEVDPAPGAPSPLQKHLDASWRVLPSSHRHTLTFLHPSGLHLEVSIAALEMTEPAAVALSSALDSAVARGMNGQAMAHLSRDEHGVFTAEIVAAQVDSKKGQLPDPVQDELLSLRSHSPSDERLQGMAEDMIGIDDAGDAFSVALGIVHSEYIARRNDRWIKGEIDLFNPPVPVEQRALAAT